MVKALGISMNILMTNLGNNRVLGVSSTQMIALKTIIYF